MTFYKPITILSWNLQLESLGVENVVLAAAFPTQGLVIGLRWWVKELSRIGLGQTGQTWLDWDVAWHGRYLDRHAWMALVALVVAARRGRTKPVFLLEYQALHKIKPNWSHSNQTKKQDPCKIIEQNKQQH